MASTYRWHCPECRATFDFEVWDERPETILTPCCQAEFEPGDPPEREETTERQGPPCGVILVILILLSLCLLLEKFW